MVLTIRIGRDPFWLGVRKSVKIVCPPHYFNGGTMEEMWTVTYYTGDNREKVGKVETWVKDGKIQVKAELDLMNSPPEMIEHFKKAVEIFTGEA